MDEGHKKGFLERFLGIFTEVRPGEGRTAISLTLNVFLILTAYYILKPVREALILSSEGAEIKSYASAGQALLLLAAVPLYGALASRFSRRKLINSVTIFFVACLVVFYVLAPYQAKLHLGVVFFLWMGIFNLMVVAQFWSFANDIYTLQEGKRLFVIVAFGQSAGAVFGSFITKQLIEPLGVYQLMLVAGGILILALMITNWVDHEEKDRLKLVAAKRAAQADEPIGKGGAFRLVLANKYLLMIAFMMLLLNLVNTTGEYLLGKTVSQVATQAVAANKAGGLSVGEYIGEFYSDFFTIVNITGLLAQLFLVSRIIKYLGIRAAILIHPLIALGGYGLLAFYPVLKIVRLAKIADNSTDYSLGNTIRNTLFLPTTREEKYKAKQAIDTFFVRSGDVLSAVLVFAGTNWLAFAPRQFSIVNVCFVLIWLILAVLIGRKYHQLAAASESVEKPAA
jgi:ATP:ADP antiporter, AAA family